MLKFCNYSEWDVLYGSPPSSPKKKKKEEKEKEKKRKGKQITERLTVTSLCLTGYPRWSVYQVENLMFHFYCINVFTAVKGFRASNTRRAGGAE